MLETSDLDYMIDDRILFRGADTSCDRGDLKVVFGDSGVGKTSFIRILAGFETPSDGAVTLDGQSINSVPPGDWRRQVILLHQQPRMFPGSIERNLTIPAQYHDASFNVDDLLQQCELNQSPDQPAHTLSGGEKQRLALARALVIDPEFLLLDEPTASLHEEAQVAIDELMLDLAESRDIGIYFVTHDTREVRRLGGNGYAIEHNQFVPLEDSHIERNDQA